MRKELSFAFSIIFWRPIFVLNVGATHCTLFGERCQYVLSNIHVECQVLAQSDICETFVVIIPTMGQNVTKCEISKTAK